MAAADHVTLKDRAGKELTVHVTGATKVIRDKKPAPPGDSKAGTRGVVTAVTEKVNGTQRLRAKLIELGKALPPK